MLAFHSDPAIKQKYLSRVIAHREADELIKGKYWENGKGCAVGCTVHSSSHKSYEIELGIPMILARLEDRLFESLQNGEAKLWPEQFLGAIRVGADLSKVWPQFAEWLMVDPEYGVMRFANDETKPIIQRVADLYSNGGTREEFKDAADAANAANAAYAANAAANAANAAYAADAAYAAYAAANAADAADAAYAANAAANAANAAYAADAAYAAANAAYAAANQAQANKLIELLRAA